MDLPSVGADRLPIKKYVAQFNPMLFGFVGVWHSFSVRSSRVQATGGKGIFICFEVDVTMRCCQADRCDGWGAFVVQKRTLSLKAEPQPRRIFASVEIGERRVC